MISIFPKPFWFVSQAEVVVFFLSFFRWSACAQGERSTHHLVALVLSQGMAVQVRIHLALIHARTGAREPSPLLPRTKPVQSRAEGKVFPPAVLTDADRSAYLSGRSLLLVPGFCPCFSPAPFYVWILSLSRSDGCCILQPNEEGRAPGKAACGSGSGPPRLRCARQLAEWKQLGKGRLVVLAARWRRSGR